MTGGGIIGCCTAYYLTRHPKYDPSRHRITLLEATEIAGGASGKAGGLLALWAYPSNIVPLSYRLHAELAKEHSGRERWGYREVDCGQVVVRGRPSTAMREGLVKEDLPSISLLKKDAAATEKLRAAGIPIDLDWLLPDGLVRYESMSGPGETAQVHPYLFTTSMAKLAEEKGTRIILGTVENICQSIEGVESIAYIDKASGDSRMLPATDVVISAGPWTRAILPEAPISSIRAHSVVIRPARPVSAYTLFTNIELPGSAVTGAKKGSRSTVVTPEIYARPDNTVYACGEGDQLVPVPPTTADVQVDLSRCQDIIDSIGSISEELREGEVMMRQACYLPSVNAARGGPLIGHTGIKGLYMATGHTCWGIQNAPGTGKLVGEFIFDGEAKSANITALDPRKFL